MKYAWQVSFGRPAACKDINSLFCVISLWVGKNVWITFSNANGNAHPITVQFVMHAHSRIYLFDCALYKLIIITMSYLMALHIKDACHVYSVDRVSKIKSSVSHLFFFCAIYEFVRFQQIRSSCDDCKNMFISSYHYQMRMLSHRSYLWFGHETCNN